MIESLGNSKIKYASKLKQKKYRTEYGQFLVEGEHLIIEAIKSNNIDYLFSTETDSYDHVETFQVSNEVFNKISELNNSTGLIAVCNKPKIKELSDKVLILDGIQDPGNMGTLIRTAAAFGFNTIVAEDSVDFYNEKVIRSSQGAIFYVNIMDADIIKFIKTHHDYHYFGTDVLTGSDIRDVDFNEERLAIILGNEGNGIRNSIKELVNTNINIPMISTESLNVGIAGGILMFEAFKEK
ncbi:RNA methyltransferase [Mycoplasmatota bacterium WC30]